MSIFRINNNVAAQSLLNLNRLIGPNLVRTLEQLSFGLSINRAGDNAAGLSIATQLQSQINGLNEAFNATQTGVNVANVADQGLDSTTDRLSRIRELAVQAANTGVYDRQALRSIQDEITQNVQEINRIANTTQFGSNQLLNGDFAPTAGTRPGTPNGGVTVANGNLTTGANFLEVRQTQAASAQIVGGEPAGQTSVVNAGIGNAQDIAVTQGAFYNSAGGTAAAAGDALNNLTFNGVSLQNGGTIAFQGTLADGKTQFSGTFQINAGADLAGGGGPNTSLADAIQAAIDNAEQGAGINTPGGANPGETNVAFNATTGRLQFRNGAQAGVSNFNLDFTVTNAAGKTQNTTGITRADQVGGVATGAQVGNAVTAITGSTFNTGPITLEVTNVVAAQNQVVQSNGAFQAAGGGAAAANTNLVGATFNGVTLAQGDTLTLNGTNANGSTFTNTITISTVASATGNGVAVTMQDLINELNIRDQTKPAGGTTGQSGFTDATAALTAGGKIQVTDDVAKTSQTNFTFTVQDRSAGGGTFGTISDRATLMRAGTEERATARVNGGAAQEIKAGQTATLYGTPTGANGEGAPQVTLRFGTNLTNGTDIINNTRAEYVGTLNGGPAVEFGAGAQKVRFESGVRPGETATLNFNANLNVPGLGAPTGGTVILSATARQANFQVGANAGQNLGITFGDTRAQALGWGSGHTLNNIDVTRPGGADEALRIVDQAMEQVGGIRQGIGAFSNRLESTANSLAVASENLLASQSRITNTDFARQATQLATQQLLLKTNIAVQTQANNLQNILFANLLR